jgi:tetratricopeptide (TPR) repeat protein
MSRTAVYKAYYFLLLFLFGAFALWLLFHSHFAPIVFAAIFIAYLIPGRILGFYWRNLLRGLRLLNARNFEESKRCSEQFLLDVQARPWIKNLIWLGSSAYSRNPTVLALNNLGSAEINLGQFDRARIHLDRAIEIDGKCPLPYYNIGVLLRVEGEPEKAKQWLAEAARLGFTKGFSDKIVTASQTRFAAIDGLGSASPPPSTPPKSHG